MLADCLTKTMDSSVLPVESHLPRLRQLLRLPATQWPQPSRGRPVDRCPKRRCSGWAKIVGRPVGKRQGFVPFAGWAMPAAEGMRSILRGSVRM
eukprot:g26251.t1